MVTAVTVTIYVLSIAGGRIKARREVITKETGRKTVSIHRFPVPKQLFAYTQTTVRLYPISSALKTRVYY